MSKDTITDKNTFGEELYFKGDSKLLKLCRQTQAVKNNDMFV